MLMVQDWKERWRHELGGTSISLMILFLLGNSWLLWWERHASLDGRTEPWLGFFLMLVVLALPLFIYSVSGRLKISLYMEIYVPFKSSSLHHCSRPFWKLHQLLWVFFSCSELWICKMDDVVMLTLGRVALKTAFSLLSLASTLPSWAFWILEWRSYTLLAPGFLLLSMVSSKLLLTLCFRKHSIPRFHF